MKINNEIVKEIGNKFAQGFSNIATVGAKSIIEYDINCGDLEERYINEDIRQSVKYKDLFDRLQKIEENPCIYYFEILSELSTDDIIQKINLIAGHKIIPAIKNNPSKDSKILYVGKVKCCFWGRLIMHLGFHTQKMNGDFSHVHGLQLFHWASKLSLDLKLHIFVFEPEMADLMEVLESKFANVLNPIIGKHK